MSSDLTRWSGLIGVVAAVMFVLAGILTLIAPPQTGYFKPFGDYLIAITIVVACAGTLVTIAGLHALLSDHYARLGAAGSLITFIGYAFITLVNVVSILSGSEALHNVRLIGGLTVLIGSMLLGAMIIRARVLPWWCGVLLIIGFPLGDILDEVLASGSEAIMLGILWGLVSYTLLSLRGAVAH